MGIQPRIRPISATWPAYVTFCYHHSMIQSFFRSFQHSRDGLRVAWAEDHSFRASAVQFILGFIIATILFGLHEIGILTWLFLIGATMPILVVETINTAIEAVTDKASPERHPLAKKAKDIGSAAVLLTRIYAISCWVVVLYMAAHPQTTIPAS